MKKDKIYVAAIGLGIGEDYRVDNIFSSDETTVRNWVNRFNKIVGDNKDRIIDSENCDVFWYDYVKWYEPMAFLEVVELR